MTTDGLDGWLDTAEAHQANLAAGYALTRAATVAGLNFDKFPAPYFGGKSKAQTATNKGGNGSGCPRPVSTARPPNPN